MMNYRKLTIIIVLAIIGGGLLLLWKSRQTNIGYSQNAQNSGSSSQSTISNNPFALPGPQVGEQMPEFSVTTIDGVALSSANTVGKILLFTSSATWCPTCITENKEFQPVYEEVKNKGVEFITVDIDPITTEENIRDFQKKYAPWNNVMLDQASGLVTDLAFNRFEITYIIDRKGVIRFKDGQITSTETLREAIGELL